jgi:hypothetical protein
VRARIPGGKWLSSTGAHRWYADPRVSIHPDIRKEESPGALAGARGSLLSASAAVGRVSSYSPKTDTRDGGANTPANEQEAALCVFRR